jgi:lysophospholipase L1-like esterase
MKAVNAEPGDRVGYNLEAIAKIQTLAKATDAKLLLAMTPLLREIGEPGPRDYELEARQRLVNFTQTQQITYLDFLPVFNSSETPESLYRDHIHLSPQGNQRVSEAITRSLQQLLQQPTTPTNTTEGNQ